MPARPDFTARLRLSCNSPLLWGEAWRVRVKLCQWLFFGLASGRPCFMTASSKIHNNPQRSDGQYEFKGKYLPSESRSVSAIRRGIE